MSLVAFLLMFYLFFKHFAVDFTQLQTPYMYLNKGRYGHPGGIIHAGFHALTSAPVVLAFAPWWTGICLLMAEFLIHYHMDFLKVQVCRRKLYGPTTSPHWFLWLGIDQFVHYLTYLGMVGVICG